MAARKEVPPVTAANKAISARHLRESVKFDEAHAREHQKAAAQAKKKLAQLKNGTGYGARAAAAAKAKRG